MQPFLDVLNGAAVFLEGKELGGVMGAMEAASAFARILGPVTGGLVWTLTVNGAGWLSYRSVFHLCATIMAITLLVSLRLPKERRSTESE